RRRRGRRSGSARSTWPFEFAWLPSGFPRDARFVPRATREYREAFRVEMEHGRSVGADRFHTKDTGPPPPPHVGCPVLMNLRHGIPGIAFVVIASGCARSALIEPSDVTFARATARMERTIAEVDATDASPTERALFVMAEGLYRYRFEAG